MCFDKDFIELILKNDKEGLTRLKEEKYPDDYFEYLDLEVEFIPKGTKFRIQEYDGAEILILLDYENYLTA